jgi:hypothetical protein
LDTTYEINRIFYRENFQEVGPLVRFPSKFLWNKAILRNFIGLVGIQSFVPKAFKGKFSIGSKSSNIPTLFLCSKGGLNELEIHCPSS